MQNIIIFGPAGAGKTTVAKMIAEMTGNHLVVSLGTKIKEIQSDLHYDDEQMRREEQQGVGQGLREVFGDEVWCRHLWARHRMKVESGMTELVIDDGRQFSELYYWAKHGFIPVGIGADPDIRADRLFARDGYCQHLTLNHETEIDAREITKRIAADDEKKYICNNDSIGELKERVRKLIDEVINV